MICFNYNSAIRGDEKQNVVFSPVIRSWFLSGQSGEGQETNLA